MRGDIATRQSALARIKNQKNCAATSKSREQFSALDDFKPDDIPIEPLGRSEIFSIQNGLKDQGWLHRGEVLICACRSDLAQPLNDVGMLLRQVLLLPRVVIDVDEKPLFVRSGQLFLVGSVVRIMQ